MHLAFIDIRWQHFDAHDARFVDVLAEFCGIAHVVRHHGAEKFDRVVRLEVRRLIRHDCVSSRMGFVEAVAGKLLEQIKNLVGFGRWDVVHPGTTFDENIALLGHFFGLLLAHRAPQKIRAAERVTREHLRRLHNLLLINHDAVRLTADWFQERMLVFNPNFTVAAPDKFGN